MFDFLKQEEKKVEYVELIYDLIFVYMIGRNNSLVAHLSGGFIDPSLYFTYVLVTLITIQIWYMTTLFINRYGSNSFSEYIGLFINMYLLYYMADGTNLQWQQDFYKYNVAWILILVNLIVQYRLKMNKAEYSAPWEKTNMLLFIHIMMIMAAVIAVGMVVFHFTGLPLTPLAMLAGMILTVVNHKKLDLVAVDFPHLTERVMLYVVFTFGEMIISISGYFSGEFGITRIYLSLCAFLIVVGLFMSYGFLYDHLLDREMSISGNAFMIIHIFIIFALSNLTMALEFMPEPEVALIPKTIYITLSFVVYYVFIFLLAPYTRFYNGEMLSFRYFGITLGVFVILMAVFCRYPFVNIAVSVALTFAIWYFQYKYWKDVIIPAEAELEAELSEIE